MSTGKRLAKRSIVGTRVCVLGDDGRFYPGVINAVRTTAPAGSSAGPGENSYSVRFDSTPPPRRVLPREFRDSDIVGPGFRSVTGVRLRAGQKVFLTFNGREVTGRVLEVGEWEGRSEGEEEGEEGGEEESVAAEGEEEEEEEEEEEVEEGGQQRGRKRGGRMGRRGRRRGSSVASSQAGVEVLVAILPPGHDAPLELRKRQEEIRLLESRKSARLMDHQDTDFARLADMVGGGERRRTSSHSIDVPGPSPSSSGSSSASSSASSTSLTHSHSGVSRKRRPSEGWGGMDETWGGDGPTEGMDECTAALVLMSLSCSPHSPHKFERFPWGEQLSPCSSDAALGSSWQSGTGGRRSTPSPPLSSDGSVAAYNNANSRWSTLNTTDEGIVIDDYEDLPKKKKPMSRMVFQCTWPGCQHVTTTCSAIEKHVRKLHLGPRENSEDSELSDHEEEFYYTEVELADASNPAPHNCTRVPASVNGMAVKQTAAARAAASGAASPTVPIASPPTLSHRDMARPPHEDPEYQRQLHSAAALRHNHQVAGPITIPAESIMWSSPPTITSPASPQKYLKLSPRPSGLSPSRKMRGETKKCRKVYGMEHREMWCTQCKWKKACSRFGD